ncbi:MAG TPA: hypothetical protein VGZ29_16775 [Terriglobia bacterium]|nr:hypothetical protein [Terriglobia bacterium]
MPDSLSKLLKGWWDLIILVSGLLAAFLGLYLPLRDFASGWGLSRCLSASPAGCAAKEFSGAGSVAIAILLLGSLLVLLAYTAYQAASPQGRSGRIRSRDAGRIEMLKRTFTQTVEATDLIASQFFLAAAGTRKEVRQFKQVWILGRNGDCRVKQTWTLAAQNGDLHFFETGIQGDDQTSPAGFPEEIALDITSGTPGMRVAWLLSRNEATEKDFVVFLLPAITAGGKDVRNIEVRYYWKGLMRRLALNRYDYFEYSIKSAAAIPSVEYQFRVAEGAGKLRCSIEGTLLGPDETLAALQDDGGEYWTYQVRNMPSDHPTKLKLEFV